ncbi:MAG: F0F1 ATP synthase subunit delta, partial [Candidatus Pacebacteria bacterium]|nr:F0F1 ATP synthase subunit delta [Candidatus Paceibacterota bacterium]
MPTEYAQALANSLTGATEKADAMERVDSMVTALAKVGKLKALPAILKEYERIESRKASVQPTLTVARQSDGDEALKELMDTLGAVPKNITVTIEDNLIGGWRYLSGDTLIDSSHKA